MFKIDGSKRSSHSQAYFFGFMTKRLVLYDTIINNLEIDEIEAVVLHEMGHWYHCHFWQMFVVQILNFGLILYFFQYCYENKRFTNAFGLKHPSNAIVFLFF